MSRPARLARVLHRRLDSVGIGGAPDAADFGDEGSATLPHIARAVGGHLASEHGRPWGSARIVDIRGRGSAQTRPPVPSAR